SRRPRSRAAQTGSSSSSLLVECHPTAGGCISRRWRSSDRTATSSCRDRQADPEAAAPAPALDADLTSLGLHEVLDDGQPEARAACLPRAASVRAVEPLEDSLAV